MRARRVALCLVLAWCTIGSTAAFRQDAPPLAGVTCVWEGRHAEYEEFLRTAPFERLEALPVGVTQPQRAFFAPGSLVASAAWKVLPPGRSKGFWENYRSEIGAYELDKRLGMHMVPPTVEKRWRGDRGAAVLWVEGVRTYKEVQHLPKPDRWNRQAVRMKMFDNLIGNIDRNQGNLLLDEAWNLFLIDHSRAFITDTKLPAEMQRIDRELWERMLALDEPTLREQLRPWVDGGAVRAMLRRRARMQAAIDTLVQTSGESAVYLPR